MASSGLVTLFSVPVDISRLSRCSASKFVAEFMPVLVRLEFGQCWAEVLKSF